MAMASSNQSPPKHVYPCPEMKLAGPADGRLLRPDRDPSFHFNVPPSSPSFRYQDRPFSPPPTPMFRNAMLREQQRRRHFQNSNCTATNAAAASATSSHGKTRTCFIVSIVFFFSVLAIVGIPIVMFYVLGPLSPAFSIEKITYHLPIFYISPTSFSSLLNITMKVKNPARHVGIFFENENSIVATYSGIRLCGGGIPPFYQPPGGETVVQSRLTGLGIILPDNVYHKLGNDTRNQRVPMALNLLGMVRFKIGHVTSRALLKVNCQIVLKNINTFTPILISSRCDSIAGFWFPTMRN